MGAAEEQAVDQVAHPQQCQPRRLDHLAMQGLLLQMRRIDLFLHMVEVGEGEADGVKWEAEAAVGQWDRTRITTGCAHADGLVGVTAAVMERDIPSTCLRFLLTSLIRHLSCMRIHGVKWVDGRSGSIHGAHVCPTAKMWITSDRAMMDGLR